jgi:DNA-binding MarR family transcriptional regulator
MAELSETSMSAAFAEWVERGDEDVDVDFHAYMHSVAQARYVVRKVIRIVHEQAKRVGLDPLEHEALLQIYGAGSDALLSVNGLADLLDVAPALASRVIKALAAKGLVRREPSGKDKRVTLVAATDAGVAILRTVDREVHVHIDYFRKQLEDTDRVSLMAIFAFWAGLDADSKIGGAIRAAIAARTLAAVPSPPTKGRSARRAPRRSAASR